MVSARFLWECSPNRRPRRRLSRNPRAITWLDQDLDAAQGLPIHSAFLHVCESCGSA